MSFQDLIRNHWSTDLAALDEQTFFLAELIYGHLIHHFSTPASLTTWPERIPRRIQNLLRRIGSTYPKVKPSIAIHALLVVLSIKEFHPMAVAFYDDVELLWMLAYKHLAQLVAPKLTVNDFIALTDGHYCGTKLQAYPRYLEQLLQRSIHDDYRPLLSRNIKAVMRYHLSPFLPAGMNPHVGEIPMMSLSVPLERHEPAGNKQTLVFPDTQHKLTRLTRIVEVEEPDRAVNSTAAVEDIAHDAASQASSSVATGLTDFASSTSIATESETSFNDSLEEDSRTASSPSASSSLTMIDCLAVTGPAGGSRFVESTKCADASTSVAGEDVLVSKSLGPSSSTLSTSSSKGRVKHNPASQLNAVFATRVRPTTYSAAYSSSDDPYDPIDLFPNFRAEAREWELQPEPSFVASKLSPMTRLRLWRAQRRERKAFASGQACGSHSSGLGGSDVNGNNAQDFERTWTRPSFSSRWKHAIISVPMAHFRLWSRDSYYA